MPLVNCIICFVNNALLSSLCYLLLKFAAYVPKMPLWVEAFSNPCEPESFHESYSSGASPDKISAPQLLRKREVNERLCIAEVGVDLEHLFSCPRTRCGTYHESFLQEYLNIRIILPV